MPEVPDHKAGPLFEKVREETPPRGLSPWMVVYTRVGISLGFLLVVVLLNLLMVWPLFAGGWTSFRDSYEPVFFSQARFIYENFPNLSWHSLWYAGFPFHLFYTPFLAFLLAFLKLFFSWVSFSSLYRVLIGTTYVVSPVFLYIFVKYLTRKELPAIFAALFYTAPLNLLAFLVPSLREDFISFGHLPWHLIGLTVYGQGPKLLSLALLPLACLFYLHSLKYPALKYYLIAAILIVLVGLTHAPSLYGLLIMLLVLLFSEIILGRTLQKLKSAFWIGLMSIGLGSFWFNASFLSRALRVGEAGEVLSNLGDLLPISFVILPVAITILFLIFDRRPRLQPILVSFLWFAIFGTLILVFNFWGKKYAPNPNFFAPELSLSGGVFGGVLATLIVLIALRLARTRLRVRVFQVFNISLFVFLIGIFIYLSSRMFPYAQNLTKGIKERALQTREEYLVSELLKENSLGGRVFVAGRNSIWLNAFTNLRQVKGFSPWGGATNPFWEEAAQEIKKGKETEISLEWLRAFGVEQIAVDSYHFSYPNKFEELEEIGRVRETVIYRLPYEENQPVKLVKKSLIDTVSSPQPPDYSTLGDYSKILEEGRGVFLYETSPSNLHFEADFEEGEVALIPMTYATGWRASTPSGVLKTAKDPLGFLEVLPEKSGFLKVELTYKPPLSVYLGYSISFLTIVLVGLAFIPKVRAVVFKEVPVKGEILLPEEVKGIEAKAGELETEHAAIKEHYRKTPDIDWVEKTDNFQGLETYFHRNREALVLKLYEEFGEGKKAIDLGCGTGLLLRHLPEGSVGLDINPEMITKAKKNAPKSALVVADIDEIPFPPATFEVAIVSEVLDRLPDPKRAIKEIERVLQPGGVVIGTVAKHNPLWRLQFLSRSEPDHHPYRKEYTRSELERLFRGFEIEKISSALSEMAFAFVLRKPKL